MGPVMNYFKFPFLPPPLAFGPKVRFRLLRSVGCDIGTQLSLPDTTVILLRGLCVGLS